MKRILVLIFLCFVLYLPGQTTLPPFDRDEARFAQATKQMVETGDYVDINFQHEPRHKKPVGIYWLQAASVNLTGALDEIWAYRVPSWLGATVAVVLTALIGRLLFGLHTGLLAGGLLASTLLMGVESRMAKTDAVQLACLCLAQWCVARVWLGQKANALLFGLALGLGLLIKGPIVPMVVGLTVLALSLIRRSGAWMKPLLTKESVALMLAIPLPWLVVITLRTHGAFWAESVGHDLLGKVASGQEGHGAPPSYYLATFFLTFWPWAPLVIPALMMAWRKRHEAAVQFLLAWLIPSWIVFELMPTKLLHYTLPTFPAVALLMASALPARGNKVVSGLFFLLLAIVALGVPLLPMGIFAALSPGGLREVVMAAPLSYVGLMSGLALLAAGVGAWQLRESRPVWAGAVFLGGLLNFYTVAFSQILPGVEGLWVSRSVAALVTPYRQNCGHSVVSIGYAEPSLVFLLGTDTLLADSLPRLEPGCQLVLLEQRKEISLPETAEKLGSVHGFNYSKGGSVDLTLYRLH